MSDSLIALSDTLTARVAAAAPGLVTLYPGARAQRTGFAWQTDVVVTSEQNLPPDTEIPVMLPGGESSVATLLGRDPGTNVAVLKLTIGGPPLHDADPLVGGLAIALGGAEGDPTASLGMVHRVGPAWDSMAGGVIDRLIRLDLRLAAIAEGGPVLDASGALLGMSTFGPRRGVMVIPAATIARIVDPLLAQGRIVGGWLGAGLHPVALTPDLNARAGVDTGLMVVSIAPGSPASACLLPGDILLAIAGRAVATPRAVAAALGGETIGQVVELKLLRGGEILRVGATVAARPQ